MATIEVLGGQKLQGEIDLQGAKNSVLPILAASILVKGKTLLHNCPKISDTYVALEILEYLGCKTTFEGGNITVDAENITKPDIPVYLMEKMRSSVVFAGSLIARTGECSLSYPGGCKIGKRPIDMHLDSFEKLGYNVVCDEQTILIKAEKPKNADVLFRFPSVGATENVMLAATLLKGRTRIIGAAKEPEIVDLQEFLNGAGAKIHGAGTAVITIEEGCLKKQTEYTVMADRICCETYLACVAACEGEVLIKNAIYNNSCSMIDILEKAGCHIRKDKDQIYLKKTRERLKAVGTIKSLPYPGFPTDSGALFVASMLKAKGTSILFESIFENRFKYVDEFRKMGAQIKVVDKICVLYGTKTLDGASVCAYDLRGGAGLVIAALSAEGKSIISGTEYIDRGYENFTENLKKLGAKIEVTGE